jgi:hypothetical protein
VSPAWLTWRCARANRSSWLPVIGPAISARSCSVAAVAIRVSARTLGIGQSARGEFGPQDRQVPQCPGDPDVLPACNSDGLW